MHLLTDHPSFVGQLTVMIVAKIIILKGSSSGSTTEY